MAPTPPPRLKTIAETHYGTDDNSCRSCGSQVSFPNAAFCDPCLDKMKPNLEHTVSPVRKTKKYYTPDMQRKIASEYQRSNNKAAVRAKYDVSQSAVCRWIKLGILGAEPNTTSRINRRAPADAKPLEDLLWTVVSKARAAGDISKEDARRLLELVL